RKAQLGRRAALRAGPGAVTPARMPVGGGLLAGGSPARMLASRCRSFAVLIEHPRQSSFAPRKNVLSRSERRRLFSRSDLPSLSPLIGLESSRQGDWAHGRDQAIGGPAF